MTLQFHTLFLFINHQPEFSHIIIPIIPEAGKYSLKMGEHVFWLMLRGSSINRKQRSMKIAKPQVHSSIEYIVSKSMGHRPLIVQNLFFFLGGSIILCC